MSSSVGMMTFPIYGKIKNVPNHQPVMIIVIIVDIHKLISDLLNDSEYIKNHCD